MKKLLSRVVLATALLTPAAVRADGIDPALDALKQQVQQMQQQMQQLQQKIQELEAVRTNAVPAAAVPAEAATPEQLKQLNEKVDQVVEAQKKVLPSEFNPSIGVVGETVFSYQSRSSQATGSDRPGGWDIWQRSVE